jgi:hypothetical protein
LRPVVLKDVEYGLVMDLAALNAVTLIDSTGAQQRLGELWADRPVALVFLRHFG